MALRSVGIRPTAFPQGLKPFDSVAFMYGLKPVPFRTKVPPFQNAALFRGSLVSNPCLRTRPSWVSWCGRAKARRRLDR